jgi:hypothetical protein
LLLQTNFDLEGTAPRRNDLAKGSAKAMKVNNEDFNVAEWLFKPSKSFRK